MNDYSLAKIAADTIAERRAEADRARLARPNGTAADDGRGRSRARSRTGARFSLDMLLHRVALR